jgi:acyl carrier protein
MEVVQLMRARTASKFEEPPSLRQRVEDLVVRAFGRSEERLFDSGLLDSLRAVELGVLLEENFGIPISELSVQDLASIATIVQKLDSFAATTRR